MIGDISFKLVNKDGEDVGDKTIKSPLYNIDFITYLQGKNICTKCMDMYHKIYALEKGIDFSCGGTKYYADGRNLT